MKKLSKLCIILFIATYIHTQYTNLVTSTYNSNIQQLFTCFGTSTTCYWRKFQDNQININLDGIDN